MTTDDRVFQTHCHHACQGVSDDIRYRALLEDQTEVIARLRADGHYLYVNDVYCHFFGRSREQLMGRCWHPVAHPDDVPLVEARLATLSPTNPVVTIENRVFDGQGEQHWMEFVNRGFFSADGTLLEIQSVGRNISERKRIELELLESRTALRELVNSIESNWEQQRKDIAQDIHDEIGATLAGISMGLDNLASHPACPASFIEKLQYLRSLLSSAHQAVRNLCNRLRPSMLEDLGLIATCRWYLKEWADMTGLRIWTRLSPLPHEPDEQFSIDIFRILQELLTNTARHAKANQVAVSLLLSDDTLTLMVRDNGCGLQATPKGCGLGLLGIEERARRHGGNLSIQTVATGTRFVITFPWPPAGEHRS